MNIPGTIPGSVYRVFRVFRVWCRVCSSAEARPRLPGRDGVLNSVRVAFSRPGRAQVVHGRGVGARLPHPLQRQTRGGTSRFHHTVVISASVFFRTLSSQRFVTFLLLRAKTALFLDFCERVASQSWYWGPKSDLNQSNLTEICSSRQPASTWWAGSHRVFLFYFSCGGLFLSRADFDRGAPPPNVAPSPAPPPALAAARQSAGEERGGGAAQSRTGCA